VPNAALRFKPPGAPIEKKKMVVWMLSGEGQPQVVPVKPGIADQQFTEMLEGQVREGDRVIVGLETLEEAGQKNLPPGFGGIPKLR
jgi:HlyD family secretion protein